MSAKVEINTSADKPNIRIKKYERICSMLMHVNLFIHKSMRIID